MMPLQKLTLRASIAVFVALSHLLMVAPSAVAEPGDLVKTETMETRIENLKARLKKQLPEEAKTNKCRAARMASNLAACEFAQEEFSSAAKHLQQAIHWFTSDCPRYAQYMPLLHKHLGDCEAIEGKSAEAIEHYTEAMNHADAVVNAVDFKEATLKAISDVYFYDEDYEKSIEHLKQLAALQEAEHDQTIGWTYMGLKDCYEKQGQTSEANRALTRAAIAFRRVIDVPPVLVRANKPALPRDLWDLLEPKVEKSPVLTWRPPQGARPWVMLLCVHGMGLHKSCFSGFGEEMAKKGALVAAMDVRGFGSWRTLRRYDELDFDSCASDIKDLAKILKTYNPGVKLFLVGESMGGAIALQSACKCNLIDGVISSVPAADRYNGKQTTLKVALTILTKPGNDFDITEDVIERTSRDQKTVDKVKADPQVRTHVSPKELMEFESFMKKTKSVVGELELPVLITQGAADPLVKPVSTVALFDAIKTPDKTLILLGGREHLIFENSQFTPLLLEGVTTWLRGHVNAGGN